MPISRWVAVSSGDRPAQAPLLYGHVASDSPGTVSVRCCEACPCIAPSPVKDGWQGTHVCCKRGELRRRHWKRVLGWLIEPTPYEVSQRICFVQLMLATRVARFASVPVDTEPGVQLWLLACLKAWTLVTCGHAAGCPCRCYATWSPPPSRARWWTCWVRAWHTPAGGSGRRSSIPSSWCAAGGMRGWQLPARLACCLAARRTRPACAGLLFCPWPAATPACFDGQQCGKSLWGLCVLPSLRAGERTRAIDTNESAAGTAFTAGPQRCCSAD